MNPIQNKTAVPTSQVFGQSIPKTPAAVKALALKALNGVSGADRQSLAQTLTRWKEGQFGKLDLDVPSFKALTTGLDQALEVAFPDFQNVVLPDDFIASSIELSRALRALEDSGVTLDLTSTHDGVHQEGDYKKAFDVVRASDKTGQSSLAFLRALLLPSELPVSNFLEFTLAKPAGRELARLAWAAEYEDTARSQANTLRQEVAAHFSDNGDELRPFRHEYDKAFSGGYKEFGMSGGDSSQGSRRSGRGKMRIKRRNPPT